MNWSWLIYLMCPLMMIPMMYFMMKGNHVEGSHKDHDSTVKEELAQLRKQNDVMQKELEALKGTSK